MIVDAAFPAYGESWVNEPGRRRHVVLGRRLRPFCYWHHFLLEFAGSPLLTPGTVPTLADLEVAVRICRARYRTPLSRVFPEPQVGDLAKIAEQLREMKRLWAGGRV